MYLRISARFTLAQTKRHARDLAKTLSVATAEAFERRDRRALLEMAEGLVPEGEITYIVFADVAGEMLAGYQQGAGNMTHLVLEDTRMVSVEPINQPQLRVEGGGGPLVDVVYPVRLPGHSPEDTTPASTIGFVRLGIGMAAAETRLAEMFRSVAGLAVGITLLMVPLGYEVVRHLVGPINKLADAVKAFARGDLDTRVPVKGRDEIGDLGRTFNVMADELSKSQNEWASLNAELENRVLQRTTALEEANARLKDLAVRDSLTGLHNRRHFSELLLRLFSEAKRYGSDITCMMLDLDNFKRVNDSLGHQMGDRLLQMTGRVILESIRESDVAVRYGGDEFVVMLPRTSPSDARASAERLLAKFRSTLMEELPVASIASLSIGMASREQDHPAEAIALVNLADEALYLAKAGGKNRITVLRPAAAFPNDNDAVLNSASDHS